MNKVNTIWVLLTILILPIASSHEEKVDPGVTPDSFLWGLDKALDNLNLLLTFNPAEKAKKGIEIARERLEEVKAMVEENKLDAAEKGKDEEIKVLSKVKQSISGIKEKNATKQIEEEIEIEKELEEHEAEIQEVSNSLKIKIEIKGELSEQQKALIDSILSALENKTGEVKVEIRSKKDKTKIKIKTETGKSEKEIEDEIENIEEEQGLAAIKKEHATEEISNAKENLDDLEKELQEQKLKGHVANETPITTLIDNAKEKLSKAEEAFKANDFGEAFGQANAAQQLIKNAKRILEKIVEGFEEETEVEEAPLEEGKLCESGGGIWKEFSDSGKFCHDECNKPENVRCARFMSMGCDCGDNKCWNGQTCVTDEKEGEIKAKINCKIGGCSGELCGESSFVENVATICLYKAEYECYQKYGKCEVQSNGKCSWTPTKELLRCIEDKRESKNES